MPRKPTPERGGAPAPAFPRKDRLAGLRKETRKAEGRNVTRYEPAVALKIIEGVAQGQLVYKICEAQNMPSATTFYRWLAEEPALREAYMGARQLSATWFEEEAIAMAQAAAFADEAPTTDRMRAVQSYIEQLKWSAIRRDPKNYSEKGTLNVVVPIQINTSLDLGGHASGKGGSEIPDIYTIEAQVAQPGPDDASDAGPREETAQPQIRSPDIIKEMASRPSRAPAALKQAKKAEMEKRLARLRKKDTSNEG